MKKNVLTERFPVETNPHVPGSCTGSCQDSEVTIQASVGPADSTMQKNRHVWSLTTDIWSVVCLHDGKI